MKRFVIIIASFIAILGVKGAITDDIRAMIDGGAYSNAVSTARQALIEEPALEGTLNALLGEALYYQGDAAGADEALRKAAAKGVADGYRWLGRMAYNKYDLATASTNYAKYFELKNKASKPVAADAKTEQARIDLARRYLQRVERIQVIDSLIVDREDFFANYRLPSQSGRLMDELAIPFDADESDVADMIFANERGDLRMWSRLDSLGNRRIVQSVLLNDGTWHEPQFVDSVLNIGNLDYPFLTADGMTLYFASDGPQSLGGMDIFMATRDPADDSYRMPQNIGMPYNSPYDDYMLAIDEVNNVGWWASDRNGKDEQVTIYVFIPNEYRENYQEDEEHFLDLALLSDISLTQTDDYTDLLEKIRSIDPTRENNNEDFRFKFPDGRIYTKWSDFENEDAAEVMEAYLESLENLVATEAQIAEMRRLYHESRSATIADEIQGLETVLDAYYKTIRKQRSDIIRLEDGIK